MIIECKTYGDEYRREIANMRKNGGQLFSYYQQYKNVKFLVLYASDFENKQIKRSYQTVDMVDDKEFLNTQKLLYKNAKNNIDAFNVWKETYEYDSFSVGVFEEHIKAFSIKQNKPRLRDLEEITFSDISGKYNEFATILRKFNISGRENAFDKLLNLFLCKIIDEIQNPNSLELNYLGKRYDDIYKFVIDFKIFIIKV